MIGGARTLGLTAVIVAAACGVALALPGGPATADSTPTPTPVIQRGDVNCDHAFDVLDPLDVLLQESGLDGDVGCAEAAGIFCSGQMYPNAVLILLGDLVGVVIEIPPCLPPDTPTPNGTPTPTPGPTPVAP